MNDVAFHVFARALFGLKKFLILFLCFTFAACSTTPIRSSDVYGSFEANVKKLNLENSFAFKNGKDEFYFARTLLSEGDYKCLFFIGFKNGQFRYAFPAYRLAELSKIYYEKHSLQSKKNLAIRKIEDFKVEKQRCTLEISKRERSASENVADFLGLVIFVPLIPLGMIFGADVLIKGVKDSILESKIDRLRLGMGLARVNKLLDKELIKNHTSSYEYYSVDFGYYQRLVMVFESDRLTGFVRGFQDSYEHSK